MGMDTDFATLCYYFYHVKQNFQFVPCRYPKRLEILFISTRIIKEKQIHKERTI